jgi:hypothetical protein
MREFHTCAGALKHSVTCNFLKLPNALADRTGRKRELIRRLSHLSGPCHRDESLKQ